MPLKQDELARRGDDGIEFRAEPLRAVWTFGQLACADSHLVNVRFACSVRVADNAADRNMCAEILLLDREHSLTCQRIIEHFSGALRTAMTRLALECKAGEVVHVGLNHPWVERLKQAVQPVAFAAGIE